MDKVLIVEDSRLVCALLGGSIEDKLGVKSVFAHDYLHAQKVLEKEADQFFIALVDLRLPDAKYGEVVDLLNRYEIPTVVFTGALNEEIRKQILKKGVVDYVFKKNKNDIEYLVRLVKRIRNNSLINVLVVDDSATVRLFLRRLLESHRLNVMEAASGPEAMTILRKHRDIMLAVIDYHMPDMNGVELIAEIRAFRQRDELSIIGISAQGSGEVSAMLLKAGATDFLKKPFINEEFNCRVMQNLEQVEQIAEIREASLRDYLTGLYNRRFFFQIGARFYEAAQRKGSGLILAMVDVDFFKKVNDTHGHHVGDKALIHVADVLQKNMRSGDIVARHGGEEFAILAIHVDEIEHAHETFDRLRATLEANPLEYDGLVVPLTASFGVATSLHDSFEAMLSHADELLYKAKQAGRNQVMVEHLTVDSANS